MPEDPAESSAGTSRSSRARERFRRLEELFELLSELSPQARRRQLAELEDAEPDLAAELGRLLGEGSEDDGRRQQLASELDHLAQDARRLRGSSGDKAGQRTDGPIGEGGELGPYRLLERLGQGGMGEVWRAQQDEPISRQVAIKILSRSSDAEVTSRFLAERQSLASMDHPFIAKVYDAGQTANGEPFLVMELIRDAAPITDYCRRRGLGAARRLRLFADVCDAIEHAHRKRVIHRDLKPSNILVTEVDGQAVPKVIDFGIAKPVTSDTIAGQQGADDEPLTQRGDLVGTPQFMSPEQASLGEIDVDTRSDVYTLGLILFELLVGELPVPGRVLRQLPFYEMLECIKSTATPRASTRLRQIEAGRGREGDGAEPRSSWRQLQGDLDRILAKALSKDRELRYGSAHELAEEVRRYLRDEPVLAAPPSWRYQAGKFFRRHRTVTVLAAVAAASLVIALAGTSAGLVRALRAEERAVTAEREAQIEAATAQRAARFLEELLQEGNPEKASGVQSFRDLIEASERKLRTELADQPELRARLLLTVGRAFRANGDYPRAMALYEESRALRRRLYGPRSPQVERIESARADLLQHAGHHEEALEVALEQRRLAMGLYAEGSAKRADAWLQVGVAQWRLGRFEQALASLEHSRQLLEGHDGELRETLPRVLNNVAILYWQNARYDQARELYEQALEVQRELHGSRHPELASTLNNLGLVHYQTGDYEAALEAHRQALSIRREVFEAPHPDLAESLNNLAIASDATGEIDEAIEAIREALDMRRQLLEPPNDLIATSEFNLARYLMERDPTEARRLLDSSLAGFRATVGDAHVNLTYPLLFLSQLDRRSGHPVASIQHAREAVSITESALPPHHPRRHRCLVVLREALSAAPAHVATPADLQAVDERIEAWQRAADRAARGDPADAP